MQKEVIISGFCVYNCLRQGEIPRGKTVQYYKYSNHSKFIEPEIQDLVQVRIKFSNSKGCRFGLNFIYMPNKNLHLSSKIDLLSEI